MTDANRYFYLTTAIDYPNSRPHIGTAFEKIGADAQARYRRMEGYRVHFQMGNDENTIKVSHRAEELGVDAKSYVDDMARQARHGRRVSCRRDGRTAWRDCFGCRHATRPACASGRSDAARTARPACAPAQFRDVGSA